MSPSPDNERKISVLDFLERAPNVLSFEVLTGRDALESSFIRSSRVQKLGLALAGFPEYIHNGRLQVVGRSETRYLQHLTPGERAEAVAGLDLDNVCCVLVTKDLDLPAELIEALEAASVPMLRTRLVSSSAVAEVIRFLERELAPSLTVHGVMLGIYGVGVLLQGESGIGKSECALDLLNKGFTLVADDAVVIKRLGYLLEASASEVTSGFIEVRGIGILNVRELFGFPAVIERKRLDICIEFRPWEDSVPVDRLGLGKEGKEFFGLAIPRFVIPVSSGRNLSTLVETAVKVHLSRSAGNDAGAYFRDRYEEVLRKKGAQDSEEEE